MANESRFAARIKAIFRFTGENASEFVKKYSSLLKRYFDTDMLIEILEEKPEYQGICENIQRAQKVAQAEIDMSYEKTTEGRNLASVFSRISIDDHCKSHGDVKKFYRYKMEKFSPKSVFPEKNIDIEQTDLRQLEKQFYEEMDLLSKNPPENQKNFQICFERISQQYMWCVTAADFEGEDVSLYDYMKVTEAIFTCLEECENPQMPYTLVAGDFSGIQKYIFKIASANYKGVAKRLRARSFYVDIVSKIFSQYIIDSFSVNRANILLQTGGKFYCIVPTQNCAKEKFEKIRDEFDKELYRKFHGMVSVNLAWMVCNDEDLEHYSDSVVKLNRLLSEKKARPFQKILCGEDGWEEDPFFLHHNLSGKHMCSQCGMELIDVGKDKCDNCAKQLEIGGKLPKTNYIAYKRAAGENAIFKDYSIELLSDLKEDGIKNSYMIEAIEDQKAIRKYINQPVVYKYMVNHIPFNEEERSPKSFDQIAESAKGSKKLAVLKSDIDVLGFLFAQGLREGKKNFGTISRVNTMSRLLEMFNCGYIQEVLKTHEQFKNVYSVFSGGDDVFLIGPWDVMPELALLLREKFKSFVADNNDITLSTAVSIFDDKTHISTMAELSEKQLECAKNDTVEQIYPNHSGRNAICMMGQIFTWEDFKAQYENIVYLYRLCNYGKVDVGILRRILKYSQMYKEYLIENNVWKLMFEPLFEYDRKRNYGKLKEDEYICSLYNVVIDQQDMINKNLFFAEFVVKTVLNLTKEERKNGKQL